MLFCPATPSNLKIRHLDCHVAAVADVPPYPISSNTPVRRYEVHTIYLYSPILVLYSILFTGNTGNSKYKYKIIRV